MSSTRRPQIENLLRGISTGHVETVRDAWKGLLDQGETAIPAIKAKLATSVWKENPRGPLAEYFGVLLSLLDELDSQVFKREIDRLLKSNLHPMHRKTVEILSRRHSDMPTAHIGSGIPVFVSSDITNPSVVIRNLERWSQTKGLALDGVTRVDVIARHPQLGYLGSYNLFFSGIVLTWPAGQIRGIHLWWRRFRAEFTFYHEVGHHFHRHIEGGQVAKQEKEADDYARSMMRKSRPVLAGIIRGLFVIFKPFLKMLASRTAAEKGNTP
jgi:hypothetical protein